MKLTCTARSLLEVFSQAAAVAPTRTPKPVLQSVKLSADLDGVCTVEATDLEIGLRLVAPAVAVERPGAVILPPARFGQILRTAAGDLTIEAEGQQVRITGPSARFELAAEDADLFPSVPQFVAPAHWTLTTAAVKRAIRRTLYACDPESTRYALGGCLFELEEGRVVVVATDGRRLAKQIEALGVEGEPKAPPSPVVPAAALKVLDRVLAGCDPESPVKLAFAGTAAAQFACEGITLYARLVEGRFPRYQDVFPAGEAPSKATVGAGDLLRAAEQAAITTSDESRGVDFAFGDDVLKLAAQAPDAGRSEVELPIAHEGPAVAISFDPKYLADSLKALGPDATVTIGLWDHRSPLLLHGPDEFTGVVMPLTRER